MARLFGFTIAAVLAMSTLKAEARPAEPMLFASEETGGLLITSSENKIEHQTWADSSPSRVEISQDKNCTAWKRKITGGGTGSLRRTQNIQPGRSGARHLSEGDSLFVIIIA